jgi:hypothetical protein
MAESAELLATVGDRGALRLLVQAKFPEQSREEQARTFCRLQRRRDRLVARIRSEVDEPVASRSPRRSIAGPPSRASTREGGGIGGEATPVVAGGEACAEGGSSTPSAPPSIPPSTPPSSPGPTGPDTALVPGGNRPEEAPRARWSRAGSIPFTQEVSS